MGKFNRGGKFSDRGSSGRGGRDRGRSGGGRGRGGSDRPSMHWATCDDCGNSCEVPFKPTGNKPVYCSSCFGNQSGGSGRSRSSRGLRGDKPQDSRQEHHAICDDCGEDCYVPFRPTGDKPVYCDNCFGSNKGGGSSKGGNNDELLKEIKALHAKFDNLIAILSDEFTEEEYADDVLAQELDDIPEEVAEAIEEEGVFIEKEEVLPKKPVKKAVKKAPAKKSTKNATEKTAKKTTKKAVKKTAAKKKK